VEASTEGVLGGYGCVNDADVKGSDAFLRPLLAERFGAAKRHLVALGKPTTSAQTVFYFHFYLCDDCVVLQLWNPMAALCGLIEHLQLHFLLEL
jgi:hypothetical protein